MSTESIVGQTFRCKNDPGEPRTLFVEVSESETFAYNCRWFFEDGEEKTTNIMGYLVVHAWINEGAWTPVDTTSLYWWA